MSRLGLARHGRQGEARHGDARQARPVVPWHGELWSGTAIRGRHGKLWKAGLGWVGHGRRGETRRVLAGPGEASNGTALKTSGDLRNEGAGCFLKKNC